MSAQDALAYAVTAPRSLLQQSSIDNKRVQGDGWGLGWFRGQKPQVLKSPQRIDHQTARVRRAAKRARSTLRVGHIRWASNPLKLPRKELIGLAHTQPFHHNNFLFVHNGTLYIPREVKAALGSWERFVRGKNDSEVLFFWLLKHLVPAFRDKISPARMVAAIRKSMKGLQTIWASCRKQHPLYKHPYHGLNWVLSNGKIMLAFCYADPRGFGSYRALGRRQQPYYALQLRESPSEITVASEPLDLAADWRTLGHGRLLIAEKGDFKLQSRIVRVI